MKQVFIILLEKNQTPFIMHASTTEEKAIITLELLKKSVGESYQY